MTLATRIEVVSPCGEREAQELFLSARRAIGIPAEQEFKVNAKSGLGWANGVWIASVPGDYNSALDVSHAQGAPLDRGLCDDWCDLDCTYHHPCRTCYVDIRLDTAYGARADGKGATRSGAGCSDTHNAIVVALGERLDYMGLDWWAKNEFDGTWHHRSAPYNLSPSGE